VRDFFDAARSDRAFAGAASVSRVLAGSRFEPDRALRRAGALRFF